MVNYIKILFGKVIFFRFGIENEPKRLPYSDIKSQGGPA